MDILDSLSGGGQGALEIGKVVVWLGNFMHAKESRHTWKLPPMQFDVQNRNSYHFDKYCVKIRFSSISPI